MKTALHSFLIALLLTVPASQTAFGQWSQIASFPGGSDDGCFSFTLHGKGYVGGGSAGSRFYEYDTTTNAWTLKGNAPGNKIRGFGFSFVAGGHGYAGCGDTTGANNSCFDLWMYNDTTNTWTQKASFPGGDRDAMLCFAINDTAYAGGGFDPAGSAWNDFYKYNPFTDTWTELPDLPTSGYVGFPASFVISGKGYLAAGESGGTEINQLWQFDPSTGTWTAKASVPGPARQAAIGFELNNYGYVGGGMAQYDTTYTDMWRYNPISNTWVSAAPFPSVYAAWSTAFTVGGVAYVGASSLINSSVLEATDTFRRFRGVANTTGLSNSISEQISVYPNPSGDYFNLYGDVENSMAFSLNDIAGRTVKTFEGSTRRFFIGDLPTGVYILRGVSSTGSFSEKIIKE